MKENAQPNIGRYLSTLRVAKTVNVIVGFERNEEK